MEISNTSGRRKTSVARIYMQAGQGNITINGRDIKAYFSNELLENIVNQPLATVEQVGQYDIKVNVRTLLADAGSNFSQWCYSTTTHEVGHSLSLADNPNTTQASIMKHNRNRTTAQFPTGYDSSEVRRIYS